jgi:hypothetical protein
MLHVFVDRDLLANYSRIGRDEDVETAIDHHKKVLALAERWAGASLLRLDLDSDSVQKLLDRVLAEVSLPHGS